MSELEEQRCSNPDSQTNHQTSEEHQQEYADAFEQTGYCELASSSAFPVLLSRLEKHDSDSVVEYGLAEDDGVQLRVDSVCVEDGEYSDGIRGGQGCTYGHGFDEGDVGPIDGYTGPQPQHETEHNGGDEGAGECKCEDGADVAEEVPLQACRKFLLTLPVPALVGT